MKGLHFAVVLFALVKSSTQQTCSESVNPQITRNIQSFGDKTCFWKIDVPQGYSVLAQCNFSPNGNQISVTNNQGSENMGSGARSLTFYSPTTIGFIKSSAAPNGYFACTFTVQSGSGTTKPPSTQAPQTCDCGWRKDFRIVNGQTAEANEFPFMAAVTKSGYDVYCGGVIISPEYVLTAGHCVVRDRPTDIWVKVGKHDMKTVESTEQQIQVRDYRLPNGFNESTATNDIAILWLSRPIVFGPRVGPVCLPFSMANFNFANANVIMMGWGTTMFTGVQARYLQTGQVKVMDDATCQQEYRVEYNSGVFCTSGYPVDSCQYDSGSPVVFYDYYSNRFFLLGLITFGQGCASGVPGGNTKVTYFLNWIRQTTNYYPFCEK